jgi:hypothetical protein
MTQVPLSERGPEFKAEYDALIQKKSELAGVKGELQQEVGEFQIYSDKINSAVGNYLTMKEDDSSAGLTFLKAGWNNILSGITGPLASAAGIPMDLFYGVAQTVDEDFGMTEEERKERYITIATDLGYDIPENIEDDAVYNKWLEGLMESTFEAEGVEGEGISATMNRYPKEIREELEAEGYDPSRVINADGLKMWNNEGGILGNGGWEDIPDYASDTSPGERLKRLVMDQEVKENKEPTKQLVRSLLDVARFDDVSEERVAAQSESVIVEGALGLAQSFPSILLGLIGRGKGPKFKGAEKPLAKLVQRFKNYATSPGAVSQTIGFSLLQTDALMQEMENDPDFKYVTETEKKALTVPLAVSTAILETYGLRSLAKGPMMGKLMTQVTKLLPKGATPKMFSETFKKVVESNIAKGVYSSKALRGVGIVGGAAAVEAETGGLQTVAEIGMKNVWNDMYEKEMFNTPEMWSEEFNNQVIRGALAEAVGGFVMGTPRALTTAFNRGDIDEVSDEMVSLFNEIRKDGTTVEAYKTQLDLKVANQELTKEEANQALLDFEVLSGAAASIEKGTELTPTQTKKALGLVYLKNKLESEMDGMDPDLGSYKAKQEMLVTIKDKLSKIGTEEEVDANLKPKKDAIQESSTTEVDVQKQAQDGAAVGEGDTTGGVAVESESETEVSPETTEEKVELTVEERAKQIEELVEQEQEDSKPLEPQPIPREQLESVDETVSINKKNAPKRINPLLDTVKRRVSRAAKAIKRIAPDVKIIMHESAEDFTAATGSRGRGTFLDNTIHINLENASGTTVAHEAFHAILLSKISTDLQAQQVTKRLMQSMAKSLDANSPLKKKIEEFVEGYEENIKNEERLAQVLGELSSNYTQLKAPEKSLVRRWIDKLSKRLGYEVSEFTQEDQDVVDLLNTLAAKVTAGVEVEEGDVEVLETEQGDGGEVGKLKVREQKGSRNSPKVETDKRSFAKFISNKDLGDFDGRDFVTNMYDFTTAGVVDIGNGITLDLQGGKSYVPFMMEKQGLNIGDVSNLAAFNNKRQAESFIRNSEEGNAKLFMPHAGTIEGSWQFQQSIFEQLMNAALDNKILSNKDIINSFNEVLTNEVGKKAFAQFKKKLGKNIRNFNSFSKNPLEIVELLNTTNNFSPKLRKALNDKLSANKKYQEAIGVKSKEAFALKLEDPLNKGVEGGDLMGVVEFDNTNFEISKPKPGDADYHPSFAWTVKAKIEGIYQPTKFYKSYDVTEEYTKYNQSGPNVSRKAEQTKERFKKANVTSSAGSQPKVAKVSKREQIIGQNAELSAQVREDLQYAKIEHEAYMMQKEGVLAAPTENMMNPAAIKEITGWELGADGKWKYEIQDGRLKEEGTGVWKLSDIYDAPEFYDAYPETKDILVSIQVRPEGKENSWYMPGNEFMLPSIEINVKNQYRVVQDLVHELQHFVQYQEGFAIGGNESTFAYNPELVKQAEKEGSKEELVIKNEMLRALSFTIEEAIGEHEGVALDKIMTKEFLEKNMGFYLDTFDNLVERGLIDKDADFAQALEDFYFELPEMDRRKLKIAQREGGMNEALDVADEISEPVRESLQKLGNFAMYERLMGEVEARNVTKRLFYTAEKRVRNTLESTEDVSREDQIAYFDTSESKEDVTTEESKPAPREQKAPSVQKYLNEQKFFQDTSPFAWAVDEVGKETLQDSQIREYKGTFGVVTPDGDIKGLFNPNVARERQGKVAQKGTLRGLMPLLIEAGGNKLDNFDGRLTKLYEDQGFRVVSRTPFNEEFAPEGWNKKDHGTPDVVAMVYDPEGKINIEEKTFEEYDDAMAYRDEVIASPKKPAARQQLGIKEARKFKMNRKGFIPKYVDMAQLQKLGRKYGLTLVKDYKEFTRDLTGYHFEDAKGQFYNPFLGQRFQKIADKFQDPVEIIKLARTAGFEDSEIKYFLQKTWKGKKKLKVKEINDLLKVDVDMFASMPAVFGNVPGGMVAGRKLYEATMKKFNSLLKKNLKRPKDKQATMVDMINESIEFMMGRKVYKEATEGVKSKTELSTLQQQLQASMQEALGGGKVKDISKKITALKKIVRQKIRGAREVRDVKRQLQRTIREVLPKAAFNKTEVRNLLRTIQDAEPKWLKGNLRNLTEKIESLAAEKNVSILNKAIQKILDNKFLVKVGGLEKLIKIDQATYKIVESIKDKMYKAAEVKDDIIKEQTKLIEQVEELNKKLELTEEEETQLLVLNIALGINNAKLMEDSNPRKADQLAEVYNNLKDLITQGRNNYKEAAKERSKRYAKNTALFHQALEGYKDVLDFTDPEVLERIRKDLKERADEKASNYGRNALKEYFKKIGDNIDKYLKMGTLGLSQLSSALDKSPGAAFEGFIKDFVYRKVNESTRMYKESMMALDQILTEKTEEYLGKDYAKKIKEYRKSIDFLELQDGKFLKDPQEVKDAQAEFDKDPTRKNKDKLNKIIRKNIPFSNLTPLQLQYLYFQYKQKDTHAGFKTSLGDNYQPIMDGLSKHFEETYPDLLELGRWQVEVLLPSLYEKYNEVYKKLYNTDLPQRDNYSGRTFRVISKGDKVEMEKYDPLSLLSEQGMPQMGMNVIGNSTKLTQKNSKAIMPVDAFTAIDTYLKDMEHFAAYAENINEISKVFFNKDIVDTIVSIHGQDVYDTIRKQLMATAQRGANQSDKTVELVNRANNIFIVQKLGAGLTVYLKQLTSIGTYGNFIGYGNWIKTATTMGPKEFIKAAKEISDESVYIKYRYWRRS